MARISITAPSSAEEGERVSVSVRITNTLTRAYIFKTEIFVVPHAYPDYYLIKSAEDIIFYGLSKTYSASFTMPDCNTTINVSVDRWWIDRWNYEGLASKVVSLEVVPEYKGSIARKELEYDETRGAIPVY